MFMLFVAYQSILCPYPVLIAFISKTLWVLTASLSPSYRVLIPTLSQRRCVLIHSLSLLYPLLIPSLSQPYRNLILSLFGPYLLRKTTNSQTLVGWEVLYINVRSSIIFFLIVQNIFRCWRQEKAPSKRYIFFHLGWGGGWEFVCSFSEYF